MVQGISASCSAATTQMGSATAAKTSSTSFDNALKSASTNQTKETSSSQDASKTSDSKSTSKSDKASSAQTTTCSKCGAVYQGDNPPAICTRCGNEISAQGSGSAQDPNSLLDTSATSKTPAIDNSANSTNSANSANAVSAINPTSETGQSISNFDFMTQIPATISLQ